MNFKDITLNGKKIGRTFCAACARRHVQIYLLRKGTKVEARTLQRGMKSTPTAFEFTTEPTP